MIKITRNSQYADKIRKYKIFVDDKNIGEISNGSTKNIKIPTGIHTIYLKIDWCKSNRITFDLPDTKIVEFNCGNSIKGIKYLFVLLYITLLKNKYLWIKIK